MLYERYVQVDDESELNELSLNELTRILKY